MEERKPMRKSTTIRLVLLGSAGLTLAACDQGPPPDARFVADATACAEADDAASCRAAFADSEVIAATEAPAFTRKEECEAEFGPGNCEVREAGGSSVFMPIIMGYMLGRAFRQPVFRGRDNRAVMAAGGRVYDVGRFTGVGGRSAAFQPSQITPVQRGGFGAAASRHTTSGG
jgi:uncharacterized protein YgiB involved in biofilm formation